MYLPDNTLFIPVKDPNMAPNRTPNSKLSLEERLAGYEEIEATYTEEEALLEASRCLKCPTHWCERACPAGVPVTDFIARIRNQDYEGAYSLISTASTLPEICSRVCPQEKQCQSECTRGINTQAVGIGRLERFVTERHYASGVQASAAAPTGKRVAVVGSGPAGLSAAQRLADLGHAVTVYESEDRIGGLLKYGIPNMKLDKAVIDRKIAAMEAQGVVFRTGITVGVDISAEELKQSCDAVVLAVGTGNARTLPLEGAEGVSGILQAVDFLGATTRALLDGDESIVARDKQVVIIGGGDTGNDCVGTALRQGCAGITQIEMLPQNPHRKVIHNPYGDPVKEVKVDASQEECQAKFGAPHRYQTTVKAVHADAEGRICAVTTVQLEAQYNNYRVSMKEIPGTEETIPCDLLIIAAGFVGPCPQVAQAFGLSTDQRTNFVAWDYAAGEKLFVCGDCRTGQSLVVKAMVDGRNCAAAVDGALKA